MKCKLAHLILAFFILALNSQPGVSATNPSRDPGGFLPVPADPGGPSPVPVTTAITPPVNTLTSTSNPPPVALLIADSDYVADDKYKLMPGDSVSFQIKEDRTNAIPLTVTESSELDVPYIGRVNVLGRTCKQLADEVKALLEKDYYHRATVTIGINQRTKVLGSVYVYGPVRLPGPVQIPAGELFTASKAILRAGGFMDFANKKEVKVIRKTATGSTTFKVNMVNVLEKAMAEQDLPLEPEDFIFVPTKKFNL